MTRALTAAVLAALLASACASRAPAARPATPAPTPPLPIARAQPEPKQQLRQDLESLFTASAVDHALWGVNIASLSTGEILYSDNATKLFLPASNQKLLTTAVAAERLGWDYRFTTRILATGPIGEDGTLKGNLVVVSNGDPSINPRHTDRWHVFDNWAAALRNLGIRAISGQLIGEDNAFEEPGIGQGWSWDNLPYGYGTAVGALQYNENQVEIVVSPDAQAGAPTTVSITPVGHGLRLDNDVKTVAPEAETSVDIVRLPGSPVLHLRGQVASAGKPVTITASLENPTRLYLNALQEALARHGISVGDGAIDVDDLSVAPDIAHATELLVDRSPPLSEIIDVCLKWSRNEYAETLLRALAPIDKPATAAAGLEVLREQLAAWNVGSDLYLARDGSGLSRQDYLSPEATTRLLIHLSKDAKHTAGLRSALPVAGVSGTLADRMKGTLAENRVWAKTGTLSNVRALSGYAVTIAGEPIVFSMIANNFLVSTEEVDATMEKALIRVIQYAPR
jgi:D-alanyl-D-alanine carboxypeptidase/D-alanyl-D-alanine-endopeptidase (penicillin-binding protein 4)